MSTTLGITLKFPVNPDSIIPFFKNSETGKIASALRDIFLMTACTNIGLSLNLLVTKPDQCSEIK